MKTRPISALDNVAYTACVILSFGGYWLARVLLTRAITLAFEGVTIEGDLFRGGFAPLAKATPVAQAVPVAKATPVAQAVPVARAAPAESSPEATVE
jgi:hypothetical protein